jgi:hypothetical protein
MNTLFDMEYRKKYRKQLVNYLYDKILDTSYPPNISAFVVKAIHFMIPYIVYIICLFAPLWLGIVALVVSLLFWGLFIVSLLFWGLFIYLNGCFLSNIEYKLDSERFINIIDPYLVMFGYPINDENRYSGTIYLVYLYFAIVFSILYIRFKLR